MATQDEKVNVAIAPASGPALNLSTGECMSITVKDFDAAGNKTELTCQMPNTSEFNQWSLMQQVVMLKRGTWSGLPVADIIWGLAYANRIGADVIMGELYPTGSGRWGTSNKFKIKQALATGKITSIEASIRDTKEEVSLPGCVQKTDLECTVTIGVKGYEKPIVRRARLSRWYKKNNPNWVGNPEHMLELNTVAHACEYVSPGPTEEDEAPPVPGPYSDTGTPPPQHTKIGNLGS